MAPNPDNTESILVQEMLRTLQLMASRNWVPADTGTCSFRDPDWPEQICITRHNCDKYYPKPEDLLLVDLDGRPLPGNAHHEISPETLLHAMLYRWNEEIGAILHSHSVWSTLISRRYQEEGGLLFEGFEILKQLAPIRTHTARIILPIFPNSDDMALQSREIANWLSNNRGAPGFLISAHGLFTWGATIRDARRHLEVLEFLLECQARPLT